MRYRLQGVPDLRCTGTCPDLPSAVQNADALARIWGRQVRVYRLDTLALCYVARPPRA